MQIIPFGKQFLEYAGRVITIKEANKKGGKYLFKLDDKQSIDGSSRTNIARYINHSCSPNAEAFIIGSHIWIWSKKTIQAKEEITINYGRGYFDKYIKPVGCKCSRCFINNKRLKK